MTHIYIHMHACVRTNTHTFTGRWAHMVCMIYVPETEATDPVAQEVCSGLADVDRCKSVCMYVCMHACMQTHVVYVLLMYLCMNECVHVQAYEYIHAHNIHMYMYINMYMDTYICIFMECTHTHHYRGGELHKCECVCAWCAVTFGSLSACMCMLVSVYGLLCNMYVCRNTYVCICVGLHVCMCVYIRKHTYIDTKQSCILAYIHTLTIQSFNYTQNAMGVQMRGVQDLRGRGGQMWHTFL